MYHFINAVTVYTAMMVLICGLSAATSGYASDKTQLPQMPDMVKEEVPDFSMEQEPGVADGDPTSLPTPLKLPEPQDSHKPSTQEVDTPSMPDLQPAKS